MESTVNASSVNIFYTLNTLGKRLKSKKNIGKLLVQFDPELQVISDYLNISQREAFLFSTIFWLNCDEHASIDVSDISRYLQCDVIDVLSFQPEVESLIVSIRPTPSCRY